MNALRGPNLGVLLITHYQRLLDYIVPDYVHVMVDGPYRPQRRQGTRLELEERGYDFIREGTATAPALA